MSTNARNYALTVLGNAFPPLAVLVTSPMLARALSVDGRGELTAAIAPYLLLSAIATLGVPDAITNFVARGTKITKRTWASVSWILIVTGAFSVIGVALLSPVLARGGSSNLSEVMIFATLAVLPTLVLAIARAKAMGEARWSKVALERALSGSLRMASLALLFAFDELTVATATAASVLSPVIAGVVYLVPGRRIDFNQPPSPEVNASTRPLLRYGLRAWLGSVAGILLMRVAQVLVLPLAGPTQLGLYAVALNVSEVPLVINSATREMLLSSDARERTNHRAAQAARLTALVSLVVLACVIAPIKLWLPIVFGVEFADAIPIAIFASIAVLVGIPGSVAGSVLSARGNPGLRSTAILIACVLNIILLVVLVPAFGAMGAAMATLFSNLVSANLCIHWAVTRHGFRWREFYVLGRKDFCFLAGFIKRAFAKIGAHH